MIADNECPAAVSSKRLVANEVRRLAPRHEPQRNRKTVMQDPIEDIVHDIVKVDVQAVAKPRNAAPGATRD